MTTIYIDIETLPALDMTADERRALVAAKVPANYKDPLKIEAWIEEHAEEAWRRTALDSMHGRLYQVGVALNDTPPEVLRNDDGTERGERDLLEQLSYTLGPSIAGHRWVGHNLAAFDLPWLWRSACRHGIRQLVTYLPHDRWSRAVLDTMIAWHGTDAHGSHISLARVAAYLGVGGKTAGMDGSQVYDYWRAGRHDEVAAYCAQDVAVARDVAQAMGLVMPAEGAR